MNGKELKVVEYNLTFGKNARIVNVFGCFRYKENNNLYIIYTDVNTKYNIIYYGSSHVKNDSILSMQCNNKKDEEIIKEYIFKVTNKESLDNFEIIPLEKIEGVEIISSNKLEIKKEVLDSLTELTIPKKELPKEEVKEKTKKKKSNKLLLFLIIIIIIGSGVYLYFSKMTKEEKVAKSIVCTKDYKHDELAASVTEEQTFNFNNSDSLESIDISKLYTFNTEDDYLDFINKGLYYKYMPESDTEVGWDKDDTAYTFKVITKERVDTSYNKPTNYEEVLSYYKTENYSCEEFIEK